LRSMTGYGEGEAESEKVDIYSQIKTLNHRFLEVEINCSEPIPFLWEKRIKEYIKERIKRGKVILNIEIKRKEPSLPKAIINQELASRYHQILSQVSNNLGLKSEINLSHILSLPNIILLDKEEKNKENIKTFIEKSLIKALKEVLQTKEKEGKEHLYSIRKYLKRIKKRLFKIEKEIPLVEKNYKKKIEKKLEEFLDQTEKKKIAHELSSLVWRGDTSEERLRLQSHLDQLQNTLKQTELIGVKLKFILQELQREINTLGAKANAFVISCLVIQIKEDLERIREEIQNIE